MPWNSGKTVLTYRELTRYPGGPLFEAEPAYLRPPTPYWQGATSTEKCWKACTSDRSGPVLVLERPQKDKDDLRRSATAGSLLDLTPGFPFWRFTRQPGDARDKKQVLERHAEGDPGQTCCPAHGQ